MKMLDHVSSSSIPNPAYKGLYKAGAMAALIAAVIFRRNLDAEWILLRNVGPIEIGPSALPSIVIGWFALLQQNQILGLTLLNVFDIVNYALVGLIFLSLFAALRQISKSWMIIAAALCFVGITLYFATNQAFTLLSLSNQYAVATTDALRAMILTAGQAVLAIHHNASYAGRMYPSFLLVSIAGLITSIVMLRSNIFAKGVATIGILANSFCLCYYIVLAFAPAFVVIPICICAIFLLIWYLLVGGRLWALGSSKAVGLIPAMASSDNRLLHTDNDSQPL